MPISKNMIVVLMTLHLVANSGPVAARFLSTDPVKPNPNTGANFNRYTYGNNNPYRYKDPDGRDAKWVHHKDGTNTLVIPVYGTGPGASPGTMQEIERRAESIQLPNANTRIDVQMVSAPGKGINTLNIAPGKSGMCNGASDCTNKLGGNRAHVDMNLKNFEGAATHEIFHFPGIDDQYRYVSSGNNEKSIVPKTGFEKTNIMVLRSGNTLIQSQLDEAYDNKTTKKVKEK